MLMIEFKSFPKLSEEACKAVSWDSQPIIYFFLMSLIKNSGEIELEQVFTF